MRKLLLVCLLVGLAVPTASYAVRRAPGDGTLQIRDGKGVFLVTGRGGLIGRCGRPCDVTIDDPVPGDGSGPVVFGEDVARQLTGTAVLYRNKAGEDMRFRIVGGFFRVRVAGVGVNASAVVRGTAWIKGDDPLGSGEYSVDGGGFLPIPLERTRIQLGTPAAVSVPGG